MGCGLNKVVCNKGLYASGIPKLRCRMGMRLGLSAFGIQPPSLSDATSTGELNGINGV